MTYVHIRRWFAQVLAACGRALTRAADRQWKRLDRETSRKDIERRAAAYRAQEIARNRTRSFLHRGEE